MALQAQHAHRRLEEEDHPLCWRYFIYRLIFSVIIPKMMIVFSDTSCLRKIMRLTPYSDWYFRFNANFTAKLNYVNNSCVFVYRWRLWLSRGQDQRTSQEDDLRRFLSFLFYSRRHSKNFNSVSEKFLGLVFVSQWAKRRSTSILWWLAMWTPASPPPLATSSTSAVALTRGPLRSSRRRLKR